MVWPDDPSLFHPIDPELKVTWAKVEVPSLDTIVQRLKAAQQKPASEDPRDKVVEKKTEKKRKTQRRAGKSTNTHMEGLLRDFSHLRR